MWAFGSKILAAVAGVIANGLLARLLSPEEFGAYFLCLSVMLFASLFGNLGMRQAVVRFIPAALAKELPGRAKSAIKIAFISTAFGVSLVALSFYLGVGAWVANIVFNSKVILGVVGLLTIMIVIYTFQMLVAEVFRGFHDIRLASIFSGLATSLISVVLFSLLWVMKGQANLNEVLTLFVLASLISLAIASFLVRRKISGLSGQGSLPQKEALSVAWPLYITGIVSFLLMEAHLWILGGLQPASEVAIYGAAYKIVNLVGMPLLMVNNIIMPMVAELHAKNKMDELEKVLRGSATVSGVPAVIGLIILAVIGGKILELVYGGYYKAGVTVLAVLCIGQIINVILGSPGILLMMSGNERSLMIISSVCGVVGIATSFILIPSMSYLGAGIGLSVGVGLNKIVMWNFCRTRLGVTTHMSYGSIAVQYKQMRKLLTLNL